MRNRILLPGLIAVIGGCFFYENTCACTLAPTMAIVYGTVTTATGSAASGAMVEVRILHKGCGTIASGHNMLTDNTGGYRAAVLAPMGSDSACVDVVAHGSASGNTATGRSAVRLTDPPDSVRVNLQLP